MKNRLEKLTPAEATRLEEYVAANGGAVKCQDILGVAPATISRNINLHTAPSPLLREKLVEKGIIKAPKKVKELTAR